MNILQTPARFYPHIGGIETVAYYLSRELVRRGHKVKVICSDDPESTIDVIEGIQVERLKYRCKVANTNIPFGLPAAILKNNFDVIHTHLPFPWSADWSAFASFLKKKPLFLTYHNDITGRMINKFIAASYNLTLLKFLLKSARKIFITQEKYLLSSPFLKSVSDKIVVAHPGVDTERFRPLNLPKDESKRNIFFLSRLDRFHLYKGLEYLLMAVKKIKNAIPVALYIGGEGDLLPYYQRLVKENGIEDCVNFLGALSQDEVVRHYNLCDIFVLPSISSVQEGFGLVALEAMACKKPVVITDIVGVAVDVKMQNAGIVVQPKSEDGLSEAIRYLFSNSEARSMMGENAYRLIRDKYTWSKHAQIVEEEYLRA